MFPSPKIVQLLLLCPLFCLCHFVHADPPYELCSNTTISEDNTPFQHNLGNLLSSLSSNASVSNFYNTTIGNGLDRLHGLFLCYEYVTRDECGHCIATASQDVKRLCPNKNEAVVWEENCQLRYSNASFFGQLDVTKNLFQKNDEEVSEPDRFSSVVNETLGILTGKAAFNASADMFATREVNFTYKTIYALVQCTTDLSPDDCNTCLVIAMANTSSCCHKSRGARLLSRSCYLRYEFYDFYEGANGNSTQIRNSSGKGSNQRNIWKIVVVPTGSTILVVALLVFCIYQTRKRQDSCQELRLLDVCDPNNIYMGHENSQAKENLNFHNFPYFDLATLNEATDNFSDSNKLGQGGFGPVYKGRLPDGKEIAVKKLSNESGQGSNEFTNEVLLILKLQHKNLVRLLGFCVDGKEQLLIYEYMPNGSLDFFLLDREKRAQMNWRRRLSIINGVARGMLYLHEDSRLRIIHRDLKPSNVLLDNEMNPKISDFGMARIFGGSDGEANTAMIVGTYGYMAPEFAMEGLYSIKSDVFSFGVLLLETITGKRNSGFHLSQRGPSLLAYAWQLWKEGKGLELIDPLLTDSCDLGEFLRCMHIGLLCVQEDACDRPTMSSVVVMLKSEAVTLSQPQRPAFSVGRFTNRNERNQNVDCYVNELTVTDIAPR